MPVIFRRPWTRQPQGAARVDWSNPLTRNLRQAMLPAYQARTTCLVTGFDYASQFAPPGLAGTPFGLAWTRPAFADLVSARTLTAVNLAEGIEFAVVIVLTAHIPDGVAVQLASAFIQDLYVIGSAGGTIARMKVQNGSDSFVNGTRQLPLNTPIVIGFSSTKDASTDLIVDGQVDTTTASGMWSYWFTQQYNLTPLGYDGTIRPIWQLGAFMWDRRLSRAEQVRVYANPWQLFAPPARQLYLDVGAGAATLTQSRYRWRNDDGSESAATWAAAENTPITLAKSTPRRLRIQVQSTNDKPSASYKLQYRKVGDPGWEDVN